MSRSYLSKRQVKWERDSLDIQEAKHKKLVIYRDEVHELWSHKNCGACSGVRRLTDEQVEWSRRDLTRWSRKVKRLEREQIIKRKVKRQVRRDRSARKTLLWI